MDPSSFHTPEALPLQACHTICGVLEGYAAHEHSSGLIALRLRGADDSEIEVLADAWVTLDQLAAAFRFAEQAVGHHIEIALDLFGFPTVQAFAPVASPRPQFSARTANWIDGDFAPGRLQ